MNIRALFLILLMFPGLVFAEDLFYRYKDTNGKIVIDDSLPAEFAAKGYELVNARGSVVKVIPAALTKEQLAEKREQQRQMLAEAKRLKRQQAKDAALLRTFASVDDIKRLLSSKLTAIDVHISITESNIQRMHEHQKLLEKSAAKYERLGKAIPEGLKKDLIKTQKQIDQQHEFIVAKQKEKQSLTDKFNQDAERFISLQKRQHHRSAYQPATQELSRN